MGLYLQHFNSFVTYEWAINAIAIVFTILVSLDAIVTVAVHAAVTEAITAFVALNVATVGVVVVVVVVLCSANF
jgi:hypothetical protein